ncbi:hypothetical protein DAPPUDRAFT_110062 [Daphnia pulex]|uniref:Uncharacterized protein n=1 Tax=Daphnia pulex TaxID=6669 RepID=E9H535_DAPPU|nr:hypothetical protein DAPPUDRAFT_110062 [Daphnia pulex]|eukprot:EFX73061.1 hypothetical protein DAPPUDRAFT_110062 [Daphnia pulex]
MMKMLLSYGMFGIKWIGQNKPNIKFKLVLRYLLDKNLPENITVTYDSQSLENIRTVWLSWWLFVGLSTLEAQSARKSLLEKIDEERLNCIVEGWRELHCKDIKPQRIYSKSLIPEAVDNFAFHLDSKFKHLGDETRKKVHEEAMQFFSKVNFYQQYLIFCCIISILR